MNMGFNFIIYAIYIYMANYIYDKIKIRIISAVVRIIITIIIIIIIFFSV